MESETACAACGAKTLFKCSACECAYYCSKEHQKEHWKKHSKDCKMYKIAESPTLGRHYVATRNIKVGEIVLKDDRPLIVGLEQNSVPVCLQCYTILNENSAVPCIKCGWPLCQTCKKHELECDFISSRRDSKVLITEFGFPHPSYHCINVIRVLSLKDKNPEAYKKFISLESHINRVQDNEDIFGRPLQIARFIKRFFKADDISEEEMIKIMGIFQVNAHEFPLTNTPTIAVYALASLLEHSCKANCSKSFTDEGGIIVCAATPIAKGDHISICYTDPLWSTENRRYHLSQTKFFDCTCERCKDPTEFGVMFNAIKCDKIDCSGYALPETFLDEKRKDYICNNCGSVMPYKNVQELLEKIGVDLLNIKKNDVTSCNEFLERYQNVLHPNHFYNIDVIVALVQLICQTKEEMRRLKEEVLVKIIELCKKIDNILKILAPAENRLRGVILYKMFTALQEFCTLYAGEDTAELLLESRKCLVEVDQLLKREPQLLAEGKIAKAAQYNLKGLDELLKRLNVR